jgi:hypothetical protein
MAEMLREVRTAMIWAAFGLGLFFATRPVWSFLLFGRNLSLRPAFTAQLGPAGMTDRSDRRHLRSNRRS